MNVDTHLAWALELDFCKLCSAQGRVVACQSTFSKHAPEGMAGMHCVGLHTCQPR